MPRTIRIALLLCDTPLPLVQQELNYTTYTPVFLSHLQDTLDSYPDKKAVEGVQLEVDSFDMVGKQEYPDEKKVREGWYDAVMMTGSGKHHCIVAFLSVHRIATFDADSPPFSHTTTTLKHNPRPSSLRLLPPALAAPPNHLHSDPLHRPLLYPHEDRRDLFRHASHRHGPGRTTGGRPQRKGMGDRGL